MPPVSPWIIFSPGKANMSTSRILFRVLLGALLVVCALSVHAQSGRRQVKPATAAPVPTPTPAPTPTPKQETTIDLEFHVAMDTGSTFEYYPLRYYTAVVDACAARLSRASAAKVTTSRHLSRGEAVKKAKAEKTTYIVLLRLTQFAMSSRQGREEDIELEFTVFAPQTGKIATRGTSYQNARRQGPVIVQPPGGSSSVMYRELLLKRAAEDAADRILKALHVSERRLAS